MNKLKKIWFGLIILGIFFSVVNNKVEIVNEVLFTDLQESIELVINLISVMAFWMGLMRIAEKSGLVKNLSKLINPISKILFKEISKAPKALNAVVLCLAANMFGLGNSATALGIKAVQEMQKLNSNKKRATNSMCMLLIINMSSIQLLPLGIIKIRADAGAIDPTDIMVPTIITTTISTITGILCAKYFERRGE